MKPHPFARIVPGAFLFLGLGVSPALPEGGEHEHPKQEQAASPVDVLKTQLKDPDTAGKLADSLLVKSGAKLSEEQTARMRGALAAWAQKNPEEAAKLQIALASDKLTPKEKEALLAFIMQNAGAQDQDPSLENLTQLTELSKNLQEKIDVKGFLEAKGGLDKFFDGIGHKYRPGGEMDTGDVKGGEGLKKTLVEDRGTEREVIKGFSFEELYGSVADPRSAVVVTLKSGNVISIQAETDPKSPDKPRARVSVISNRRDIRGEPFDLAPGGGIKFTARGQTFTISVKAERVKDKNGVERDDLVVHVVPGGKGEEEVVATAYGADGLLARRLRTVKEDGYIAYLGEGEKRRKFYVTAQGGASPKIVMFPADRLNEAYEALKQGKEPKESHLLPRFAATIADSDGGKAKYRNPSEPIVFGGEEYRYVIDPDTGNLKLKKLSAEETSALAAKEKKKPGGDAREGPEEQGTEQGDGTGPTTAGGWPARLPGSWQTPFKLHKINTELAARGVKYRIYEGKIGQYAVIGEEDKGKVLEVEALNACLLKPPRGGGLRLGVEGDALTVDSSEHALLFPLEDPLGAADPSEVNKRAEEGQTSLGLKHLSLLGPALYKLGFNQGQIDAVAGKVAEEIAKGGEFSDIQGTKTEKGHQLMMVLDGLKEDDVRKKDAGIIMVWPLDKQEAEKHRRAGESERERKGGGAKSAGDRQYMLNPKSEASAAQWDPEQLTIKTEGGEKTLYRSGRWPGGLAFYYDVDIKKIPPADRDKVKVNKYAVWVVWKPKAGKTLKDARFNAPGSRDAKEMDFERTSLVTQPLLIDVATMTFDGKNYVAVEKEEDAKDLVLRKCSLHPGSYAVYLQAPDDNNKYERFLKHVIYGPPGDPGDAGHGKEEAKK